MVEERYLVGENDESLFAVKNDFVFQIAFDKKIYPLPFSKNFVGGFFLGEEFLIPVFFLEESGFGEYTGSLLVLNFQGHYFSLPIKRVLEFCQYEAKAVENIEHKEVFTQEVMYKDLFEIPVLDIEKLYKLAGFN
jgi:hypothetical protein